MRFRILIGIIAIFALFSCQEKQEQTPKVKIGEISIASVSKDNSSFVYTIQINTDIDIKKGEEKEFVNKYLYFFKNINIIPSSTINKKRVAIIYVNNNGKIVDIKWNLITDEVSLVNFIME